MRVAKRSVRRRRAGHEIVPLRGKAIDDAERGRSEKDRAPVPKGWRSCVYNKPLRKVDALQIDRSGATVNRLTRRIAVT